jgi:aminopeptidase N
LAGTVIKIMNSDSVTTSHPISVEVKNPTDISQIFDSITYGKGGAIIRMMNYFLGESVFKNGLSVRKKT